MILSKSSINSQSVSNSVLNMIREYFSSSGFLFENDLQVKAINGREEALNTWIAANYLDNTLQQVLNLFWIFYENWSS